MSTVPTHDHYAHETRLSAVYWPSIFAGAISAVAISLVLFLLATGFGLATSSPWAHGPRAMAHRTAVSRTQG